MKEQVLSHLGTACTIASLAVEPRLENGSAPAAQNLELHPEIGKVSQKFCNKTLKSKKNLFSVLFPIVSEDNCRL